MLYPGESLLSLAGESCFLQSMKIVSPNDQVCFLPSLKLTAGPCL